MNRQPTQFEFVEYRFDPESADIGFTYRQHFDDGTRLDFTETISLTSLPDYEAVPQDLLARLLESMHLMLGISYYKMYFSEEFLLHTKLSRRQADFFNTVYKKGLGEFMFRNRLNPKKIAEFTGEGDNRSAVEFKRSDRGLLGIGGGKDSIVAGELLKKEGYPFDAFTVTTGKSSPVVDAVIGEMKVGALRLNRRLDPALFEEHEGAYNGHIPISAIIAFLGVFSAVLFDYSYVIVGNEQSSNFGNIKYKKLLVNHQWSKSQDFEELFGEYVRQEITPDVRYFSLLRPFHEIRIVEMFAKHQNYFPIFTSCNAAFKIHKDRTEGMWCGECPKCAFIFTLLAGFVPREDLIHMFKKNLLDEDMLLPLFKDLLGLGKMKPFDCVGTFDEMRVALAIAAEQFDDSIVVEAFSKKLSKWSELRDDVMSASAAPTLPHRFIFLGIKNLLLLGYGQENQSVERFVRAKYPAVLIEIADQKGDPDYLARQTGHDLIVRTPSIPLKKITGHHTTAANLFFSRTNNTIIGVTGTKGKSTTAKLIYTLLKEGGVRAHLVGNIGVPALNTLMDHVEKDDVIVYELSSFMLEDLRYSPHIAVVTALFPDHMDHHGSVTEYYEAKKNIFRYQRSEGYFVYNVEDPQIQEWLPEVPSRKVSYLKANKETTLPGEHNQYNIGAAIEVAHMFDVREDVIDSAIETFCGLSHRLEQVGEFNGITFYDDAISTTPESTIEAIKAVGNVDTIFLGGQDRGYDFKELEKVIAQSGIRNIVLFPDSGKKIIKKKKDYLILETDSMKDAVKFAYENTAPGKAVLLSTASPSYSVWRDFNHKGEMFKREVLRQSGKGE